MSDTTLQQNPLFTSEVVYRLPYSGEIHADVPYCENDSLVMDIYYPAERNNLMPVVVFVTGYPDSGFESMVGKKQKEVMWYSSWAKLIAASGFIAITYTNIKPDEDLQRLTKYIHENAKSLGIDRENIGLIASSGNVPNALSALTSKPVIKCAALCYGYMMDFGNSKAVANAQEAYGFSTPKRPKFPDKTPMLIIRAGEEENIGLNISLDQFIKEALKRNAPIELINNPKGKHAFDMLDNSKESIEVVKRILSFYQSHLST